MKLAALVPLAGWSVSYARNLSDSVALEGAFDRVAFGDEVQPPAGFALAQVRFSGDRRSTSEKFLSAGIIRTANLGERDWLGFEGFGLALGGGLQHLWTDRAGLRTEFQYVRFEEGVRMTRMTLGVFFGFGD